MDSSETKSVKSVLDEFGVKTVDPLKIKFKLVGEIFKSDEEIEKFNATVKPLLQEAVLALGERSKEFSGEEKGEILAHGLVMMVSACNSTLPINHPFIMFVIGFEDEIQNVNVGVMRRSMLPGYHDIMNPASAPIIIIKNKAQLLDKNLKLALL